MCWHGIESKDKDVIPHLVNVHVGGARQLHRKLVHAIACPHGVRVAVHQPCIRTHVVEVPDSDCNPSRTVPSCAGLGLLTWQHHLGRRVDVRLEGGRAEGAAELLFRSHSDDVAVVAHDDRPMLDYFDLVVGVQPHEVWVRKMMKG